MEKQEPTFSESDIAKAVKQIAASVVSDCDDLSQLVLVGAMDGAVFLLGDLMRELEAQGSGERIQETTARMESYQGIGPKGVRCMSLPSPSQNQGTGCSDSRRHSKHWGDVCMSEIEIGGYGCPFRENLRNALQLQWQEVCGGSGLLWI